MGGKERPREMDRRATGPTRNIGGKKASTAAVTLHRRRSKLDEAAFE